MTKNNQYTSPFLRFPEFEEQWVEKLLSDFLTFKNGINARKEDYGTGYKFINVLDIINSDFITHDDIIGSVNVSSDVFNKNIVEYGDILFQRSSETRNEVGQANVYLDKNKSATFGGFVIRGKAKEEYDPLFMNTLLKTTNTRKEITAKSGGSTRFNVGQDTLSSVRIFTTNIKEQIKISTFLSVVDKRTRLLQTKKEELTKYKKGVMQKIFSQEIRFKDENGQNFPDWQVNRLEDISEKKSSNISANSLSKMTGKYKIYGASGYLQDVDFFREEEPYISIVKDGAGVGRTLLCDSKSSVLGTLDIIKPKKNNNLDFLYNLINKINFKKYITGSTIPHIYYRDYSKERILVPSISEQEKIAHFLKLLNKSVEKIDKQIDDLLAFKQSLIQKMFV